MFVVRSAEIANPEISLNQTMPDVNEQKRPPAIGDRLEICGGGRRLGFLTNSGFYKPRAALRTAPLNCFRQPSFSNIPV